MHKIVFVILLILFCRLDVSAQMKITQEEYAVYAVVLKDIYKYNRETYSNKSHFVILNKTKADVELLDLVSSRKYRKLVADFKVKNSTSEIIEKRFPSGAYSETYYLVSQTEVDELLERGRIETEKLHAERKLNSSVIYVNTPVEPWIPFFQKYPESSGLYILSRVGFSGQFALVHVKGNRGWNGFSRNYILEKVKGEWRIVSISGSQWK